MRRCFRLVQWKGMEVSDGKRRGMIFRTDGLATQGVQVCIPRARMSLVSEILMLQYSLWFYRRLWTNTPLITQRC